MKSLVFHAVCFWAQCAALSQGVINFNNRVPGSVVAPIYGINPSAGFVVLHGNATTNGGSVDYTGYPLLSGTGWTAALWAGQFSPNPNDFQQLAMTTFQSNPTLAGFIQPISSVTVPWVVFNNTPVDFQVRVWDNMNGTVTSWMQALANPIVPKSASTVFNVNVPLAGGLPANLTGLTSFNIPVPEPSLLAIGVVGATLVFWRTRRQRHSYGD